MKKLLAVLLAAMMIFTVCACAPKTQTDVEENKDDAVVENGTEDKQPEEENNEADASAKDDNVLVMATNAYFKPYEYYEGDKIVGIDAEIAQAIATKLGKELKIEDMAFDSITTSVQEGSADFGAAGMTVTEERLKSINFTSSYANGVQSIIVKEGSDIKTVDDLYVEGKNYKGGVQLGTTGDIYATDDFGKENVVQYSNANEACLALKGDSIDFVIIDNEPAKALVNENEGLVLLETSYADEDYAICVAKDNDEMLNALNAAIEELTANGTIDAIIAKYIK